MEKSKLTISTIDSFQSSSETTINCCICLEEIKNEESYMPNCKHSWCFECNEMLNKNSIEECPICKNKFKSILKKGRWKLVEKKTFYNWKWEEGSEDSKKKLFTKKIQEKILNYLTLFTVGDGRISGISV